MPKIIKIDPEIENCLYVTAKRPILTSHKRTKLYPFWEGFVLIFFQHNGYLWHKNVQKIDNFDDQKIEIVTSILDLSIFDQFLTIST